MYENSSSGDIFYILGNVNVNKIWGFEDWIVSAHSAGVSSINLPQKKGVIDDGNPKTLFDTFYKEHKELFGIDDDTFPLLIKILTADDDLSIQVHPDDKYAKTHEDSLGKTECWYILDAQPGADIIVGQTAENKEKLQSYIESGKILDYLNIIPVKAGDFIFIPAGTVHAIRKNTKLLEIQQSSDVTYRLFDYNRTDDNGQERELHIKKSLDVINFQTPLTSYPFILSQNSDYIQTILTKSAFFYVHKYELFTNLNLTTTNKFKLLIVINGKVEINKSILKPYQAILIPVEQILTITNREDSFSTLIVTGV